MKTKKEKTKINFTILLQRLVSKTPKFWKKVQKFAVSLGISAVAVLVVNTQFDLNLPVELVQIIKYSIAVFAAIAGTAQFTKEDK